MEQICQKVIQFKVRQIQQDRSVCDNDHLASS